MKLEINISFLWKKVQRRMKNPSFIIPPFVKLRLEVGKKICHLESQGLCTSKGDSKKKSNIREVENSPRTILYVWLLALLTYLPCD